MDPDPSDPENGKLSLIHDAPPPEPIATPGVARWLVDMVAVIALGLFWLSLAGLATKAAPPRDLLAGFGVAAAFIAIQLLPARRFHWTLAALFHWPGWRSVAWWVGAALLGLAAEMAWAVSHYFAKPAAPDSFAIGRAILAVALFPLIEEVTFRGWIQQSGEKRLPPLMAMLIGAFLFAALHSSGDWLPRLDSGLLLGAALLVTRSLWVTLAMHMAVNLLAVLGSASAPLNAALASVAANPPAWIEPLAWLANLAVGIAALAVAVRAAPLRRPTIAPEA